MPEKLMRVSWDDGAHLSNSRKKPGSYSPLTRNVDRELGQVTLSDVDDGGEESSSGDLVKVAVAIGLTVAAAKAAPYVRRWWQDRAGPSLRGSLERVPSVVRRDRQPADSVAPFVVDHAEDPSSDVAASDDSAQVTMTSAQWQDQFLLLLRVGIFQEEQWRLLSRAKVEDADLTLVQQAMQGSSLEQAAHALRSALESDQSPLELETASEVLRALAQLDWQGAGVEARAPERLRRTSRITGRQASLPPLGG